MYRSTQSAPRVLRRIAILLFSISTVGAHAADDTAVGSISEVEGEAQIASRGGTPTAVVGAPVHLNDELRTGTEGHLEVTFRDDTVLTLGEDASITIDRYVFNPDQGIGEVLLQSTQGAFHFATGRLKELQGKAIMVTTPVANIGVRGTEFWAGPDEEDFSVLLLEGAISVDNQAGSVALSTPGQATAIRSRFEAPRAPMLWSRDRIDRALKRTFRRHGLDLRDRDHGPDLNLDRRRGRRTDKGANPQAGEPRGNRPAAGPSGPGNALRRHLLPPNRQPR
jgi:hypothetical protein